METFLFDSAEFRKEVADSTHVSGEIDSLRAMAEPGMIALDVGANRGVTTVTLARAVGETGHVWAFEPVPEYFEVLQTTLDRNSVRNVTAHQLAITDGIGEVPFHKCGGGSGIVASEGAEELRVATHSIDEFVKENGIERVDVISADCEGSEMLMLQGARGVLTAHHPRIFCEIHHDYLKALGQSAVDVVQYLSELGYHVEAISMDAGAEEVPCESCTHIRAIRTPVRT